MSDNGLPKATMINFIKRRVSDKRKISAEFTSRLLDLSKQFIDQVSSHANQICEKQGKKTINNDHFFCALKELGMGDAIKSMQKIDESLKIKQQKKLQDKQRVQQSIDKLYKRQSQLQEHLKEAKKQQSKIPMIESRSNYNLIQLGDDSSDFVEILEKDEGNDSVEIINDK